MSAQLCFLDAPFQDPRMEFLCLLHHLPPLVYLLLVSAEYPWKFKLLAQSQFLCIFMNICARNCWSGKKKLCPQGWYLFLQVFSTGPLLPFPLSGVITEAAVREYCGLSPHEQCFHNGLQIEGVHWKWLERGQALNIPSPPLP